MAGYVAEYRKHHPEAVFIDAGDYFDRGSSLVSLTRGEAIIGAMACMGYDMAVLGNHDWAYGDQRLRELLDMYPGFTLLGSNLGTVKGNLPRNVPKVLIKEFSGIRVGFLGITLDSYGKGSQTRPWLYILDCIESTREAIAALKAGKVDLIVAVTHLGFQKMHHETKSAHPSDVDLVKEFPDIKVVVGGHSHTSIDESVTRQVYKETGGIIVQCAASGLELGCLKLYINSETRAISSFEAKHIPVDDGLPEHPAVAAFIKQQYMEYMPNARTVIGEFREDVEFHNLAYWYSDFLRAQAGADIVLLPRRSIYDEPTTFFKSRITVEKLFSYFYDHYLVKGVVKGSDLLAFCSAAERRDRFNPFHHRGRPFSGDAIFYSGMTVRFDKADSSVNFGLDPEKEYTLVIPWPFIDQDISRFRHKLPVRDDVVIEKAAPGLVIRQATLLPVTTREMLVRALQIIPVEVVARNIAAGSLAKRLGLEEGTELAKPVLEFYYKSDELGDPMINEYHIDAMGWAAGQEMAEIKEMAWKVNNILVEFLRSVDLILVDFKLEFGRHQGRVLLGDEISPDTCRFWDAHTREKLDKDRFRRDMGGVEDAYQEVLRRLKSVTGR